ncbi:MAG: glycosyltransferase [Planctomycetota bacterium]
MLTGLKILYHAIVELDVPDGHAIHTREICTALAHAGHEITLAAPRAAGPPVVNGLTNLPLRFHGYGGFRLRLYRRLARRQLEERIARERPDVIVDKASPLLSELATIAERLAVPLVVELNGVFERSGSAFERQTFAGLRRAAATGRLRLLGVSPRVGEVLEQQVGLTGIPFQRFENGANVELFHDTPPRRRSRSELGVEDSKFLLGFLGADNPQYDFAAMLAGLRAAVANGVDAIALFAGSPALHRRIAQIAEQLGIAHRVRLHSRLPYEDVAATLRALDAGFVLWRPEVDHMAPTALKLKELLLCGVPVICDVPDSWYAWPLADAVHRVEDHQPESIGSVIEEIAADAHAARTRAARGRDIVIELYSWPSVGGRYGRVLADWCQRKPS